MELRMKDRQSQWLLIKVLFSGRILELPLVAQNSQNGYSAFMQQFSQYMDYLLYLAALVGVLTILQALLPVLKFIRIALNPLNTKWATKYGVGSWAIVTGCTQGIGKAFCQQLAALKFNLVLVSRNPSKLQNLSSNLKSAHPQLQTVICQADFSDFSKQLYDRIEQKISKLDISILVNNVGLMKINKFDGFSQKEVEQQINTNLNAMTYLTHRVLPYFLNRKSHKCAVINLSSQLADMFLKNVSIYTATKAYNHHLSRCLAQDYKGVIDVLSCTPGIVTTPATNNFRDNLLSCRANQCASWTLKALGISQTTDGYWLHVFLNWGQHLSKLAFLHKITLYIVNKTLKEIHNIKTE